jgi:excisionase family DNA binding protein
MGRSGPHTEHPNAVEFFEMTKCYTTKEAGELLRVCPETIRRIVREGAPHRRVGRKVLFTDADLAAILESKSMRGEVNPFRRKNKNKNESEITTNESSNHKSDGGSAAIEQSAVSASA